MNQFLRGKARARGVGAFHKVTVALRSFLRFVFLVWWIPQPLAGTILPAAGWRDTAPLPEHPTPREMTALLTLAECDARPAGARDWALGSACARARSLG